MSIELFFREFLNEEIEKKIKNYKLIRLMGWVSFRTYTGMGDPQEAIIDTGALHTREIRRTLQINGRFRLHTRERMHIFRFSGTTTTKQMHDHSS